MEQTQREIDSTVKKWGSWIHLSGLLGSFFPPINIIAPFIIWRLKKDQSEFINEQAKEAVNFQITFFFYYLCCLALFLIIIGAPLLFILYIFEIIVTIQGAIKARKGHRY